MFSVSVCTGAVTVYGPFPIADLQTAAARAPSSLYLGDAAGVLYLYPLPMGPPMVTGALVVGATALTEGPKPAISNLRAGADAPVPGSLFNPGALVGSGPGDFYGNPEGDLVWNHATSVAFPMRGSVDCCGVGFFEDVRVSRNGSMPFPHSPYAPNTNMTGLAYDGFGQLCGSDIGANLYAVGPHGGVPGGFTSLTLTFPIPGGTTDLASTPQCIPSSDILGDLGDAPDRTNHSGRPMTAYPGVAANYPTVYSTVTGSPEGPIHWVPGSDSFLGDIITAEQDADLLPDADGITNIDPPMDAKDRDGGDDGILFPISLPQCQQTQFQYRLNVVGSAMSRYTNAWIDFNRDGDWADSIACVDSGGQPQTVSEWVVQDQTTNFGPGVHVVTTPSFWSASPEDDMWLRITLSESPAAGTDGRGAVGGFEIGETEDFLLHFVVGAEYAP